MKECLRILLCAGLRSTGRKPYCTRLLLIRGTSTIAHRFTSALRVLPLLLSIGLAGVSGAEALASGCGDWGSKESEEFWRVASVKKVEECLTGNDFAEPGRGDASKPLMMAARYSSDPAILEALIAAGARMGPDEPGRGKFDIALHEAASYNRNPAVIHVLLQHGMRYLNSYDDGGGAPLHNAAANGNIGAAEALILAGAEVNLGDRWFLGTPLHYAAMRDGNAEIMALLVSEGADVNKTDCNGDTPLHDAAKNTKTATTLQALLDAGADANARNVRGRRDPCGVSDGRPLGATPLHFAARHNESVAVIRALLTAGADPNMPGGDLLITPLHVAAGKNENPGVVQALLDAGANVNARSLPVSKSYIRSSVPTSHRGKRLPIIDEITPLHLAARANSHPGVIAALIAAGANIEARDEGGWTPLHHAAMENDNPEIIAALIRGHADVNARSLRSSQATPLLMALRQNKDPSTISMLIAAGADIKARDLHFPQATPLDQAARHSTDPSTIVMLVSAGADVSAKDNLKATPLHYAATFNDNPDIVVALVDAGADVHARMRSRYDPAYLNGETPLHRAARYNEGVAVTQALLDAGADPRARDEHGDTPLDLTRYSSVEVRALFEALALDNSRMDPRILPAGTRLVIPRWVLERYEKVKHEWGKVRTYLTANYFITGPSLFDKRKETGYIPLARWNGPNEETIMVDITNYHSIDIGNENVFVTERDTIAMGVTDSIRKLWGDSP